MNNVILQLKKISINLKNDFCKIYINYSKEDYFRLEEDFFKIRVEIHNIERTIKECEKFIHNTFEDKFGHDRHFASIEKEIEYYKCLLSSKKEGAAELYKRMGCEDRLKELEERRLKYEQNTDNSGKTKLSKNNN